MAQRYIIQDAGRDLLATRAQVRSMIAQVVAKGGKIERRASWKRYGRTTGQHGQLHASYLLATIGNGSAAIFRAI